MLRSFLVSSLALLVFAGCGPRETRVDQGTRDQILHLGNLSEPRDLDPLIIASQQDFNIAMALFEGLMNYEPRTLAPVPGVASSYELSGDGLTYTFHLRPEARWSNGDPVTAHDFVFAFQRILSPKLASEYSYMHFTVKGARDFNEGRLTDFPETGYEAVDDRTLRITLEAPTPYFLNLLPHSSWFPVHPPTILQYGSIDERGTRWTRPGNMVGNGPFILEEWTPNQVIAVRKSPTYWDTANVRLNGIRFYPIESSDTEERSFRSGQLHATSTFPSSKIDVYKREHPELIHLEPFLATGFYRFNVTRKPLDDARVRRALSMTVNREKLIETVMRGGQLPARGLVPPGTGGYNSRAGFDGGPEEARKLLAEAGYPGGAGFPTLQLLINSNNEHQASAEAIQQMWRSELGIDVAITNQEAKVWEDTMRRLNYDIARYAWVGDYPDPNTFLDMFVTGVGNNQTGWSNPRYDELIAQAGRTFDPAERFELLQQAEQILIDDMPILPIYFYTRVNARLPEIRGWHHTILDLHPYNRVHLERTAP